MEFAELCEDVVLKICDELGPERAKASAVFRSADRNCCVACGGPAEVRCIVYRGFFRCYTCWAKSPMDYVSAANAVGYEKMPMVYTCGDFHFCMSDTVPCMEKSVAALYLMQRLYEGKSEIIYRNRPHYHVEIKSKYPDLAFVEPTYQSFCELIMTRCAVCSNPGNFCMEACRALCEKHHKCQLQETHGLQLPTHVWSCKTHCTIIANVVFGNFTEAEFIEPWLASLKITNSDPMVSAVWQSYDPKWRVFGRRSIEAYATNRVGGHHPIFRSRSRRVHESIRDIVMMCEKKHVNPAHVFNNRFDWRDFPLISYMFDRQEIVEVYHIMGSTFLLEDSEVSCRAWIEKVPWLEFTPKKTWYASHQAAIMAYGIHLMGNQLTDVPVKYIVRGTEAITWTAYFPGLWARAPPMYYERYFADGAFISDSASVTGGAIVVDLDEVPSAWVRI